MGRLSSLELSRKRFISFDNKYAKKVSLTYFENRWRVIFPCKIIKSIIKNRCFSQREPILHDKIYSKYHNQLMHI